MSETSPRVGVIHSRFNENVGALLLSSCLSELANLHAAAQAVIPVPGALELPWTAKKMAESGAFDVLVALGVVIRGETFHFEMVAQGAILGLVEAQLITGVPLAMGVLTTDNEDQALVRAAEKGRECAKVAIEMAALVSKKFAP